MTEKKVNTEELLLDDEGADKRSDPRVNLKIEISLHSETNFFTGFSVNISTGGVFVSTHVPAKVGEKVPISFQLPNSPKTIETIGVVKWYREYNPVYPETPPGMGIMFEGLSKEDEMIIDEYINTIREPYFHPGED